MPVLPPRPGFDPSEDQRLVERCLAGDARAWAALVRRYERLVYAVARSYRLSDPDLADVFQDVFAALVRGLPRLRDARALCRWLSSTTDRIARAIALRRRRELALHQPIESGVDSLVGDAPPVGADLELVEEQALVRIALEGLPERCRTLLQALYYEDPTPDYAALSLRLRMPVGSLGPTRARCFDRMRRILSGLGRDELAGIGEGQSPTFPSEDPGSAPMRRPGGRRTRAAVQETA
jgi:RNA polymerase sigma factor (sigma-70 family)